ncbi:MAG: hypothetical protein IJA60_07815 [Clostridia bacterium]|nr:hypothetical protein [Clostridia bacterium]
MKKKKVISFGLLIAAFVFFCNPNVNILDFLPDCFACLFVVIAISRIGDLCEDLGEAKRAFITLFWINISKFPAMILVAWITGTNMNEQTMWLLAAFCYAVGEAVFTIRAFSLLFEGLAYLATRNDGGEFIYTLPTRHPKPKKNGKVRQVRPRRFESLIGSTIVFTIAKVACYALPEFIFIAPHDDINPTGILPTHYRPLLIGVGFVVCLFFSAFWLIKMIQYVSHLKKRSDFWDNMRIEYETKVLPRRGIFVMRRVHVFAIIVAIAAVLSVDLYLDEINRFPDFISAALFFSAACVIGKEAGNTRWLKLSSIGYFVTSVVTFVTMIGFKTDYSGEVGIAYTYDSVHKVARAKELYTVYAVSNLVTQIAFLFVMFSLAAVMMRIVRAHTGINTLTGVSNSSRPLESVYASRIMRMRFLSFAAAVMSALYFYFVVDVERVPLRNGGQIYMAKFEVVWMVDFVIAMIYAIHAANLATDLSSEVNYKYKYE